MISFHNLAEKKLLSLFWRLLKELRTPCKQDFRVPDTIFTLFFLFWRWQCCLQDSTSPRVPSRWRSAWLKETPARPLPRDQASSPQETSPTNPPTLTSTQQVRTWMTCTVGMNFSTCSHSSNISAAALKNPEKKLAFLYFRFPRLKVSRVLSSENLHGYVLLHVLTHFIIAIIWISLLFLSGAGIGEVEVMIMDPAGKKNTVTCNIEDKGNSSYRCTYKPTMEGQHTIYVTFAGGQISKSPFMVTVGEGKSSWCDSWAACLF